MNKVTYKKKVCIKYGGPNNYTLKISESIKIKTMTRSISNSQELIFENFHKFKLLPIMNLIVGAFGMNCFENLPIFYPIGLLAFVLIIYAVIVKLTK